MIILRNMVLGVPQCHLEGLGGESILDNAASLLNIINIAEQGGHL